MQASKNKGCSSRVKERRGEKPCYKGGIMTNSEVFKVEELLEVIGRAKILSSKDLELLCKTVKEFKGLRSEAKILLQDKVFYMSLSNHHYGALQEIREVLDKWGIE